MFTIERSSYGLKITLQGFMNEGEMAYWLKELTQALQKHPYGFRLLIDARELKPLPKDAQTHLKDGQELAKRNGVARSIVILNHPITAMQFKRIGKQTGVCEWERYINAAATPQWEHIAMAWLDNGVDPDA